MVDTPSQFIVPQYDNSEAFVSGSGSDGVSGSGSAPSGSASSVSASATTASEAPIFAEQSNTISASDIDIAELAAALQTLDVQKPVGAGIIDSIFGFFAAIVELLKYIFRSLSDGIGINEFQFGYIVLGLGALFMTIPLWGEPRLKQAPLPRNSRNSTIYTPVVDTTTSSSLQPQI